MGSRLRGNDFHKKLINTFKSTTRICLLRCAPSVATLVSDLDIRDSDFPTTRVDSLLYGVSQTA